jgi:CHAT domain-containing protein
LRFGRCPETRQRRVGEVTVRPATRRSIGRRPSSPHPATASEDLCASEIAALKLDADWVVLSTCNTPAGGATNAEALSGLGRAFIYAGARSLLVSHWAVYSEATVKLITGAVSEMSRDPKVGRAEAMRRSMLALIDKGSKEDAHPAFWAPFVVVGEGAAGR